MKEAVELKDVHVKTPMDEKIHISGSYDNPVFTVDGEGQNNTVPTHSNTVGRDGDEDEEELGCCSEKVEEITDALSVFYTKNYDIIWNCIKALFLLFYYAYFIYCMYHEFGDEGSIRLMVCTILGTLFIFYKLMSKYFCFDHEFNCTGANFTKFFHMLHIASAVALTIGVVIYIIVAIGIKDPRNLVSAGGMAAFVLLFYVFSAHPSKVRWRPVFWGLAIQFVFALIILRWEFGYRAFEWLGKRVSEFLSYSNAGAAFVFGTDTYEHHLFAFKLLPTIIFFSSAISVFYYLGVMQFVIRSLARVMATLMGTSAAESLNAAGNIFIGQSESPLMIRPFIQDMTCSELHAICTGGFATIAGSVLGIYIFYGVPANHLLSASVMSAPAALAMSKLFYPETSKPKADDEKVYKMEKAADRNIIEAASRGASMSVKLIANVAVNLIAFISILAFVNATLQWFGERAGLFDPVLSFQLICSYLFWPVAFLMGVEQVDCLKVAELVGIKTFINEFVAYEDLSKYINNVKNVTWYESLTNSSDLTFWGVDSSNLTGQWEYRDGNIYLNDLNITLEKGLLEDRSIVISTYALCGFSNIGSIGVMLGALGAMAPNRQSDVSRVVVRAMIAGNVACFMTACIAGLLYDKNL